MANVTFQSVAVSSQSRANTMADTALLVLRLALGMIFIAHGGQKVFGWWGGHGLAATVGMMHGAMGVPIPLAYLAAFTEFFGGVAVLLGLLTRLAALGLSITMLVAIFAVHLKNGLFSDHMGFEFPLSLLAIAVALILMGPGRLAIGDFEPRWFVRR